MDYSDEENFDFNLTQEPVRDYSDTQSANYGVNVVEEENVVSLEANIEPNFEVNSSLFGDHAENDACDNIQIEDISTDEEVENM